MNIVLQRFLGNDKKTLGNFYIYDSKGELLFMFKSLELPWRNNQVRISCIPVGTYEAIVHNSPKFGWSLWLQNVPGRTAILVHRGNYTRDILGCILIGLYHDDIDNDKIMDVVYSTQAVAALKHYIGNRKKVQITITQTYANG
jgi:hypothetical protein